MIPLIIVCDFDETLSKPGGVLPYEVITGLQVLNGKSIRMVLASGRPLGFLLESAKALKPEAYIAENGNILYFPSQGKTIFEDGRGIVDLFKSIVNNDIEIKETMVEMPVKYRSFVEKRLKNNEVTACLKENKNRIMVMPQNVNKGRALREALRIMKAQRESTIGFGDGENDCEIFKEVKVKVAVANAADTLKREADYITSKPYGYGVLEFLKQYLSKHHSYYINEL